MVVLVEPANRRKVSGPFEDSLNLKNGRTTTVQACVDFDENCVIMPKILMSATQVALDPKLSNTDSSPLSAMPLNWEKNEFRLWRFRPRVLSKGELQIEVKTFCMDSCPSYVALSYEWGSTDDPQKVYVNNEPLFVTDNFWDFLDELRDSGSQWFWADQLSMDQNNVAERNHQVGLMSEIYSQAEAVHAWIGLATEDYRRKDITTIASLRWVRSKVDHSRALVSCLDVLASSYWTRLWIVQEIRLSRQVVFWYGPNKISWTILRTMNRSIKENWDLVNRIVTEQAASPSRPTWLLKKIHNQSHCDIIDALLSNESWTDSVAEISARKLSWTEVLNAYGRNVCKDDRDRVFGLQALLEPSDRIPVDYGKTFDEISCTLLKTVLLRRKLTANEHKFPREGLFDVDLDGSVQALCEALERVRASLRGKLQRIPYCGEANALWWSFHIRRVEVYVTAFCQKRGQGLQDDWHYLWAEVRRQASTDRQKRLAATLSTMASQFLDNARKRPEWPGNLQETKDLKHELQQLILKAATLHGFREFEEFLAHPKDWLCGKQTSTSAAGNSLAALTLGPEDQYESVFIDDSMYGNLSLRSMTPREYNEQMSGQADSSVPQLRKKATLIF